MAHLAPKVQMTFSITMILTEEEAIALEHLSAYDHRTVADVLGNKISTTFIPGQHNPIARGLFSLLESARNLHGPLKELKAARDRWRESYDQEQG